VSSWLTGTSLRESIGSIPAQFALLFDRVFGERHFSRGCFNRSCLATIYSVMVVSVLALEFAPPTPFALPGEAAPGAVPPPLFLLNMFAPMVLFNFVPDYFSLLETRWAIRWMTTSRERGAILSFDVLATAVISLAGILFFAWLLGLAVAWGEDRSWYESFSFSGEILRALLGVVPEGSTDGIILMVRISFISAFFTSIWLWLYTLSAVVASTLIRIGRGVGFLLRMADVDQHPFRSVGFTGVLLVSGLFLVGLPFVLLR